MTEPATFVCSICNEPSTDICIWCTKDACPNHRCQRCLRCSDCCECDDPMGGPRPETGAVPAASNGHPHMEQAAHMEQSAHAEPSSHTEQAGSTPAESGPVPELPPGSEPL